ncbi:MAG TPA: 3-dehydroquinate synthase [Terriglobia bacterium]|nr:3-dehydroquinate synthase [Terriglobia bacterium]
MQIFRVRSKDFTYQVVAGQGAWRALREFPIGRYSSAFVVSEEALWRRWKREFLKEAGLHSKLETLLVPPGERSKSIRELEKLAGELLRRGADRRSLLVLFGGGVIGDLGGFLASVYMRGVDCVHVPTTLLAQVDSSVGGKTAVNLGAMKNLLGTFYPARLVLSEPRVLSSMRERDFRSGLYEVVKHAILDGPKLFGQLEGSVDSLRPGSADQIEPVLARAVKVKVDVVNHDEREAGLRAVLNLGHTFGHAIEEATHYRRFLHGEAVGWGLLAASRLSQRLGLLETSEGERIEGLILRLGPLPPVRDIAFNRILRLLPQDKKAVGGKVHWVAPEKIGKVRILENVPTRLVAAAWQDVQRMTQLAVPR